MSYRDTIPKAFWHDSEPTPVAQTVGELIDQLSRLPRDIDLKCGFVDGAMVVLYNIDTPAMHVELCEPDDEFDIDDFDDGDEE